MAEKQSRLAGLTEEELRLHGNASAMCDENTDNEYDVMVVEALESLAAAREEIKNLESNLEDYKYFVKQRNKRIARLKKLLEKAKGYVQDEFRGMAFDEEQEQEWQQKGQDLVAAIAAELEGKEGGK